jgi:POT family proton-dependent oligopeptide transporter
MHREARLGLRERLGEIRRGFEPAFWVANTTELFERLSYYATNAVLAIFLHEQLKLTLEQTGALIGFFGFVVWFLPVLGGTLADRFGFRRSLMFAYLVMTVGYFLLGSLSTPWMAPLRGAIPLKYLVGLILLVPALGPSVVKPCVAGTTARSSAENVRSIGYSIYYTIVNIGGTLGPLVASLVRRSFGIEDVFRVAALSVFLMFWVTLFFFREPERSGEARVERVSTALGNMVRVMGNGRFMLFLLLYSGFWIVFWQQFVSVPLYVRGYVNANANVDALLSVDAGMVILFQVLVSVLTRKIPAVRAITVGILVSSLAWLILTVTPAQGSTRILGITFALSTLQVAAALAVLAIGEMMQSARYYEYVSRLAPPGQQGMFMGYAFLPIAIGYFIAGPLAGYLLHHFGEVVHRPQLMWWWITGVGVVTALMMGIYDRLVKPETAPETAGA